MDKTQEIKAQIEELLKSDEIDYSRFTTLSNELLKQDREHVRFSVDAGIITWTGGGTGTCFTNNRSQQ